MSEQEESITNIHTTKAHNQHAPIRYVDGMRFNRALRAGIRRVIGKKEYLNKINVFPVPDGDTGTNMAFTLNSIRSRLKRIEEEHVGKTLTEVADSAIDGARGNSGAILAQFFQGLSDGAAEVKKMTLESFSIAVTTGANYARQAMSEPKEGTILTVVHDFAKAIEHKVKELSDTAKQSDFITLLEHGLDKARISLAETPQKLEVLRKSGVVDAGAQGFVELIEGITEFIKHGSIADLEEPLDINFESSDEEIEYVDHGDIEFRYCTECVIVGSETALIDHKHLRETLNDMGNSVVVAGSKFKTKVHIHTNEPNTVFKIVETFGAVQGQKADDMQQQAETAHQSSQEVIVVTDSVADLPEDLVDELNIHVVPARIHFGGKTYLDNVSLTHAEFYQELVSNPHHPKTSQPTPGDFRRQFEYLASHFKHVVYIGVTSQASGTYQSAELASKRVQSSGKVYTIDTKSLATGQALIVIKAAEMALRGESIEAILEESKNQIDTTEVFAYIGDISYAVKGGRVPKHKETVARLLRLNPILAANDAGTVVSGGAFFGKANRPQKFLRFLKKKMDATKDYRVLVSHAATLAEGQEVLKGLLELPNVTDGDLTTTGTGIGCHGGPGTVCAAFQEIK